MKPMNTPRIAAHLLSLILIAWTPMFALGQSAKDNEPSAVKKDAAENPKKNKVRTMPDLSGRWVSDSPNEYFVRDTSPQPVNTIQIEKSDSGNFDAMYIGELAAGVTLDWDADLEHFEGSTQINGGVAVFIVTKTDDPDIFDCEIEENFRVRQNNEPHRDRWRRTRAKSSKLQNEWKLAAEKLIKSRGNSPQAEQALSEARSEFEKILDKVLELRMSQEKRRIEVLKDRLRQLQKPADATKSAKGLDSLIEAVDQLIANTDRASSNSQEEDDSSKTVLKYEVSSDLTVELIKELEELYVPFQKYLKKAGFRLQNQQCNLRIQPGMGNAHYYHTNRSIVMDPSVLADRSVLCREYDHHALAVAQGDKAKEIFESCSGIESALADYFGCSFHDDPVVGRELNGGFLRNIENEMSFLGVTDNSGRHAVGLVVSGAIWELRESMGKEILDPLLIKAWTGIEHADASNGQVVRFVTLLLKVVEKDNPKFAKEVRDVFEKRDLVLP